MSMSTEDMCCTSYYPLQCHCRVQYFSLIKATNGFMCAGVSDDNRQATRLVFTDSPKFAIIDAAPAAAKLTDKAASTTSGAVIKAAEGSPTKHAEASPIKPDNAAMPVEDTRSIPAVKTDSRTETSPGSKDPPSTKAKKTTNTSTAAKQPLEENTQVGCACLVAVVGADVLQNGAGCVMHCKDWDFKHWSDGVQCM